MMEHNVKQQNVLLVKYGEIYLRGKNRVLYEDMLANALRLGLSKVGNFFVKKEQGRFVVEAEYGSEFDYDAALPVVTNVFGVVAACKAVVSEEQGIEELKKLALEDMLKGIKKQALGNVENRTVTFKVETSRADKRYPMLSNEVSALVGEYLLNNIDNLKVDVKKPDITVRIELRSRAYIYSTSFKGPGGLPPNSAGKAILLLSGGFDSPVAGYFMAKRGVEIVAVYFHSPPFTSERAKDKVRALAERLASFTGKVTFYCVPFTDVQLFLKENVPSKKLTIFLKRAMMKAATLIARRESALALVMGDSVGQVASQTLQAVAAVNSATDLPVLRPLCGMDKMEIVDEAIRIGTHDISALPYDDCCTLFVDEHPETKPRADLIEKIERGLDSLEELIRQSVDKTEKNKI